MRFGKAKSLVASMAVLGLALTGCANSASSADGAGDGDGSLKVLVLGGLGAEGILANNAATSVTAAEASVAAVNEAGGILGKKLEIEVIDDRADPTVAVTKLREKLAEGEKPVAVMNSGPSTVAEAILPVLTQKQILSFNIGPTETSTDPSVNPLNFDLSPSVQDYIDGFVPEIQRKKYEKVAVLHGSSATGELFGKLTEQTFTSSGLKVTGNEGYDNAALDMTPQLEKLKSSNPDALVLDSYGAPLAYVLQGIEKLGWDIPVIGNNSVAATSLVATDPPAGVLGTSQVKNLTMQVFESTKFDPKNEKLNAAVKLMAETGTIGSSLILAYNYDAMWLLKSAAESSNSLEAKNIAEALLDSKVQEAAQTQILPKYAFTSESHAPHMEPEHLIFISPSKMVNGQFQ